MTSAAYFISSLIGLYQTILFVRILLSWIPTIRWYNQPWRMLDAITEPLLSPFRKLIPPIGGIDFSPILLFLVLDLLKNMIPRLMLSF